MTRTYQHSIHGLAVRLVDGADDLFLPIRLQVVPAKLISAIHSRPGKVRNYVIYIWRLLPPKILIPIQIRPSSLNLSTDCIRL